MYIFQMSVRAPLSGGMLESPDSTINMQKNVYAYMKTDFLLRLNNLKTNETMNYNGSKITRTELGFLINERTLVGVKDGVLFKIANVPNRLFGAGKDIIDAGILTNNELITDLIPGSSLEEITAALKKEKEDGTAFLHPK